MNKFVRALGAIIVSLSAILLQNCEKEGKEPEIPYYQFSAADQLWLGARIGDEWVFETSAGKQQKYLIEDHTAELKKPYVPSNFGGIISGSSYPTYYYDRVRISIKRLDTLDYNWLEFRKTIPTGANNRYPPAGKGEFIFGGLWRNYIGNSLFEGVYGNLNVHPNQLDLTNNFTIVVNGKTYDRVIIISPNQANYLVMGKSYIKTIYYAQQAGIIRMVSTKEEIWDRVP